MIEIKQIAGRKQAPVGSESSLQKKITGLDGRQIYMLPTSGA